MVRIQKVVMPSITTGKDASTDNNSKDNAEKIESLKLETISNSLTKELEQEQTKLLKSHSALDNRHTLTSTNIKEFDSGELFKRYPELKDLYKQIDYPIYDNYARVYTKYGEVILIDRETYKIKDVLDEKENSIVKSIDMFSDEADECELYGGNQGDLINNYIKYLNDEKIKQIISKYFPNEEYTDEDLRYLFAKMNSVGCGYIATVNMIFEQTKNLSDEEFYKKFGFERYTIQYTANGEYVKTFNYNYMFLDYFLYYQINKEKFSSLSDIYEGASINQNGKVIVNKKKGAKGIRAYEATYIADQYLKEKGLEYNYNLIFSTGLEKLLNLIYFYNPFGSVYLNKIREAISEGKKVGIDIEDFTMYYPEDIDGNGKLDDVASDDVGPHAMIVTGVTDDGALIVSSWGKEYIVRPNAANVYNIISGLWRDDTNLLDEIVIYD